MANAVLLLLLGNKMGISRYLDSITKTKELFDSGRIKTSEIDRIGQSECWWATHKFTKFKKRKIKKGDVFQFDFGKNLEPEMSYEHRGLVIGKSGQLLYVLPIFSYVQDKHKDLYNANGNPTGNLYLLSTTLCKFITHDSVLKLNDIRSISTKRLIYRQNNGHLDCDSSLFREIELLAFSKYFPSLHYEFMKYKNQYEQETNEKPK